LLYDLIAKALPQLAGAGLEAALLGAVQGGASRPRAPNPRWAGVVKPADFVRLVGELLDMLGWPGSLLTEAEAFGSLGRREQFERLAGVVDLLGAASGPEGQARSDANPFCRVCGQMSGSGAKGVLKAPAKLACTGTA
jgi:hypothetical protein